MTGLQFGQPARYQEDEHHGLPYASLAELISYGKDGIFQNQSKN